MAYGRPPEPRPPTHETLAEQTGCAYTQLVRDLANWSLFEGGATLEVLEISGRAPLAAEAAADARYHVELPVVVTGRPQGQSAVEPAERREFPDRK